MPRLPQGDIMNPEPTDGNRQVDELAELVNKHRKDGKNVLVHCQAGLNRSSLVACRALMIDGMTAEEAIKTVREKRSPACLCNKSFEKHLLNLSAPTPPKEGGKDG